MLGCDTLPGAHWKTQSDWDAALRGRVGYAFDRTLIYAAGGVAFTNLKTSEYVLGVPRGDVSGTKTGWTIGVGIEHTFTERLLARIEYRYADFGTKEVIFPGAGIPFDIRLKTQDVRVGLAYKF